MKKILLILSLALIAAGSSAGAMEFKHQQKGVTCEQCHGTKNPAAAAKAKSCMKCHSYADVAAKSKNLNPNPHDSHAGELRCTLCHKEHSQSVNYCRECHKSGEKFEFKVP